MARGDLKTGRRGSLSPFELADRAANGDAEAERLFLEYAEATKGRRIIAWSQGLLNTGAVGCQDWRVIHAILAQATAGEPVVALIARLIEDTGSSFEDIVNAAALELARQFLAGDLSYDVADDAANWLWHAMLNQPGPFEGLSFPDTAFEIYEAFDAGEYQHGGPSEDPVEAFTIPMLREILDGQR